MGIQQSSLESYCPLKVMGTHGNQRESGMLSTPQDRNLNAPLL